MTDLAQTNERPRVVIVGAGFAGLSAALGFRNAPVEVTVIDRHNYHLFQPLLYQVATAGLSPADIASPIRHILRSQKNTTVLMARVTAVDKESKVVTTDAGTFPYDYLIIATGARHAYFGHDEWEASAPGLKKVDDAIDMRRRILHAFERAESASSTPKSPTFVVIGGGPTGVELAGAIAELARKGLAHDFRHIAPSETRVLLLEGGPRILSGFPVSLSAKAERQLQQLGVEVRTNSPVTACDLQGIEISGAERIACDSAFWAAGVSASPAAKWLKTPADTAGRVQVTPELTIPNHPDVFVIGDTASVKQDDGSVVPGVAPAAKQMGSYAAKAVLADIAGRHRPTAFRYRNYGNLATIGRTAAVADFGWLRVSGWLAWILWTFAHIYFLIGFRNRLAVLLNWAWNYITFDKGARLITGGM